MEGNKDEALKCLRIGKEALKSGDRTCAIKFLNKVLRLDPSLPINDLLSAAEESSHNPRNGPETPAADHSTSSSTSGTIKDRVASKDHTEEQLTIVHQIKKKKDHYQILGVERNCTVQDVQKAYRKLSLKVHPDKNKAPGAEEAFKAVSRAFQCLSNEESRKRYDLVGSQEPNYDTRANAWHRTHGFNGFYDDEFDPDEIFRNFFAGGPRATTPPEMPKGNGMHGWGNACLRMLVHILPIIIYILVKFLLPSDPVYSLSFNHPYQYKVETSRGVAYFMKSTSKFEQDYPYGSSIRRALERRVERDYVKVVSQDCLVELQRRTVVSERGSPGFITLRVFGETPHCDLLQKFRATA